MSWTASSRCARCIDEKQLAEGLYEVPALTKSWARATEGLYEKLEREGEEPRRRPITFDAGTAKGRHDIVLAHLGHPLVDMSARLLRAAVWSRHTGLHRVTAVVSDDPALETTLVGAYSRFVLVGKDGIRLHEEILYAGGWMREDGTFRRVESLSAVAGMLDRALTSGTAAAPVIQARLADQWQKAQGGLITAIERRKAERLASLNGKLAAREEAERKTITTNAARFAATLRKALKESDTEEDALFSVVEARSDEREIAQWRRDRENWQEKLNSLDRQTRPRTRPSRCPLPRDHAAQLPGRGHLRRAHTGGDPMSPAGAVSGLPAAYPARQHPGARRTSTGSG